MPQERRRFLEARLSTSVCVGPYELLEPLGQGGMGIVYRARDPRLGRVVAIKFIAGAASLDPGRRARFLREARAEAALAHPNIATVLDVGEAEINLPQMAPTTGGWGEAPLSRVPYLVLEYVAGDDLRSRLLSGPLPPVEAVRIARQIAAGLTAAHGAGIVHRDLKPANIRLTPEGLVKILDFGLARFLEPQAPSADEATELATREGAVLGTLPYMAPEQAAGEQVDARADLFALGVMLFEMVAGKRPFRGDTTMALLRAVLSDEPSRLDISSVGCSPRYAELVNRLLAKEPAERPVSAREVLHELDEIARDHEQQPTSITRGSAFSLEVSRALRRGSRSPNVMLIAGALVLLIAAGALVLPRLRSKPASVEAAPVSLQQLAVLPFANSTGDSGLDYVGRGMSSALIGQLAAVPGLSVASPSETRKYVRESASARDVARELGVGSVLEASLRPDPKGLGIDATLTDGATGRVFWSRSFAAPRDEVQRLAKELTSAAVSALSVPLTARDRERLARDPTASTVAFDFYLRGKSAEENLEDPQAHRIAAGLFERATERDPQFALAFAACADSLVEAWNDERDSKLLDRAETFARRALELDAELAESRLAVARVEQLRGRPERAIELLEPLATSDRAVDEIHRELARAWEAKGDLTNAEEHLLAMVSARPGWWASWNLLGDFRLRSGDYAGARAALTRARELAPEGQHIPDENLAMLLAYEGRTEDSLKAYEAIPGSPSNAATASNLGTLYFFNERFADAERQFRIAIRLAPRDSRFRRNLADTLLRLDRPGEARDEYTQALRLVDEQLAATPADAALRRQRTLYLARSGRCDDAIATADELERELPATADLLHDLARAPALCGRPDQAIARLRRGVELGYTASLLASEDELAALRNEPGFRALVGGD